MLDQELLGLPARGVASEVESQLPGFKPCFGGEELHRALAALTGDVVGGTIKLDFGDGITPSTAQLSTLSLSRQTSASDRHRHGTKHDLPSLQLKDLHAAAKLYDAAAVELGASTSVYDLHYSHGLVLQELASKTDPGSMEHRLYLEQACAAYEAAAAARPNASAALYNWGVALSDLARVLRAAANAAMQQQQQQQQPPQGPAASPSKGATPGATPGQHGKAAGQAQGQGTASAASGAAGTGADHQVQRAGTAGGAGDRAAGSYLAAARRCLALASEKYQQALACQPCNPQALNNWGLVLQEVSAEAESMAERDRLVRYALDKFRCAVRMRPDFDRGCYNLGTVCYSYACTLQSELGSQYRGIQVSSLDAEGQRLWQAREAEVRTAFATAAQYICLAYALSPGRDVYRRSRALVRSMLPLPFLRAGFLLAPIPTTPALPAPAPADHHPASQPSAPSPPSAPSASSVTSAAPPPAELGSPEVPSSETLEDVWRRDWFVLDHLSLRAASGLEGALSATSATIAAGAATSSAVQHGSTAAYPVSTAGAAAATAGGTGVAGSPLTPSGSVGSGAPALLSVALSDIAAVRRCHDPTLPGHGIWLQLHSNPLGIYLAAESEEAADVWADCLVLASHIAQARGEDALADALAPA